MSCNISIDHNSCIRDGACVKDCPRGIFYREEDGSIGVNEKISAECIKCGHCIAVCPGNAITVEGLDGWNFKPAAEKLISYEEFLTLQMNRRSIRQFKPGFVSNEIIEKIIEAARYSPTAKNTQSLSWMIINGREKVLKIAKAVAEGFSKIPAMAELVKSLETGEDQVTRNASQLAIVYGPAGYPWGSLDAALATSAFDLAATTLGVGTCWGGFVTTAAAKNHEIAKLAGLKDGEKVYAAMMFGYPDVTYRLVPQRNPAKITFI